MMAVIWFLVVVGSLSGDTLTREFRTLPNGIREVRVTTPGVSSSTLLQEAPRPPSRLLAQTLWVDRNHQYSIVYSLGINAAGDQLVAGWGLNNNRVSHYWTADNGNPDWAYYKENDIYWFADIMVSMARTAPLLGVTFPGEPVDLLSPSGPTPLVSLTPDPGMAATRPALSRDGTRMAYLSSQWGSYRIKVYDVTTPSNPQFLWSTDLLEEDGGVYGLNFSPDGAVLVVTQYSKIRVFDVNTGTLLDDLPNSSQTEAKASDGGEYIVAGNFSGMVQVYHWDGTQYVFTYYATLGTNTWVTTVDITPDANTVVAGTFRYSPTYSGAVYYFRKPTTGTPPTSLDLRWSYSNYGDYVADVEVSDDGRALIAGSWGTYGATYGDVITILDSTGGVIHAVQDDIDEPGSCFVVDISPDGRFAIAGGKAVHAREFGNGGFLYAFRIIDPYDVDLAWTEIQGPPFDLHVGESVALGATVANIGTTASGGFYALSWVSQWGVDSIVFGPESVWVNNLEPGDSYTLSFGPWTPQEYWTYEIHFAIHHPGDADSSNNTASRLAICYHDMAALEILYPFQEVTVGYTAAPRLRLKNMGSYMEDGEAFCEITDTQGTVVYQSQAGFSLLPHHSMELTFPEVWAPPDSGSYTVKMWTEVVDDFRPENDTLIQVILGTPELLYDDGTPDAFYIVSSTWEGNRFAVRFLPSIVGPYDGIRIRAMVNASDPIIVGLYTDDSGLPDTTHPLLSPDTVGADQVPGWAEAVWNTTVSAAETLWVVLEWLPWSPSSPGIGADANDPIDLQSYWFSYSQSWNAWTAHDWMVRLYLNYVVGVEEQAQGPPLRFMISAPYPNPTPSGFRLDLQVPKESPVKFTLFDPSGRRVWERDLGWISPGTHGVTLRPLVRTGLYFLKVQMGPHKRTFKVILRP